MPSRKRKPSDLPPGQVQPKRQAATTTPRIIFNRYFDLPAEIRQLILSFAIGKTALAYALSMGALVGKETWVLDGHRKLTLSATKERNTMLKGLLKHHDGIGSRAYDWLYMGGAFGLDVDAVLERQWKRMFGDATSGDAERGTVQIDNIHKKNPNTKPRRPITFVNASFSIVDARKIYREKNVR